MGEVTGIAWTDHTFNPWMGCTRVSPGCEKCYAEKFVTGRMGLPVWGVDAPRKVTSEGYWKQPLRWNRAAAEAGVRRRVFCASLADVFEIAPARNIAANVSMNDARRRLWMLIAETPHLDWLLLTKRPQNVMKLVPPTWQALFPENVWLGITAEDQDRYDERWKISASIPARIRFVSHEPALGPLVLYGASRCIHNGDSECSVRLPDWVITGGESGPGARAYDIDWARRLILARGASLSIFVKQFGANPHDSRRSIVGGWQPGDPEPDTRLRLKHKKGGDPSEWPAELRVQEFPR